MCLLARVAALYIGGAGFDSGATPALFVLRLSTLASNEGHERHARQGIPHRHTA